MDAFEKLVCQLFHANGWWTESSYKVDLTKADKVAISRPSCPRWEIDVVAFKPRENRVLAIECKSFLDSRGVSYGELSGSAPKSRYKLFTERVTRQIVLARLKQQLVNAGLCLPNSDITLCMAAGKVRGNDEPEITALFERQEWSFFGPNWVREQLHSVARQGYTNEVASVVAKLLLKAQTRTAPVKRSIESPRKLNGSTPLELIETENPKRRGSKAHGHYECYKKPGSDTVGGALANGVRMEDIRHDMARGFIKIG